MVALPPEQRALLTASVGEPRLVRFVDMTEIGRNPSRIIPAVIEFVQEAGGRPCRFLGHPLWPGRTVAEIDEVMRHEALIEPALSWYPILILSMYERASTPAASPVPPALPLSSPPPAGTAGKTSFGVDLGTILSEEQWPLGPPAPHGVFMPFGLEDLAAVRAQVHRGAERAGIQAQKIDDIVLAANEVVSNSVRYGGGEGTLAMWVQSGSVICEVFDSGVITDPLVGRYPPGPDLEAKGLWLVNQLCDLVQVRSGAEGTRIRLRVDC